jgi:sulfur dioxygenase
MFFRQLFDAASSTYTYLLADEKTKRAVLVDTVFEQFPRDSALLRELGLELVATLETHVHADHVTAAWLFREAFGSDIVVAKVAGVEGATRHVSDGDEIRFGNEALRVMSTPGHTDGCVTYVVKDGDMGFTGDALLIRGAGRTDFQQGDAAALYRSITQKILALPETCKLYPGHDYSGRMVTTVGEERAFNPRFGGDANERDFVGYMENLNLPHPKQIDVAVPANLRAGRPESDRVPAPETWGPVVMTYAGVPEIDAVWVHEHPNDVLVLDVREPDELTGPDRRIAGSMHVPLGELRERVKEVPSERPVVAVCRSGKRSAQATVILGAAGVKTRANLAGGMLRWNALGLPVA